MKKMDSKKNNLSKYLVDYNKNSLNSFFNVGKYPKTALTVTTMAIVLFLLVSSYSPLKDSVMTALYPKPESQASEKMVTLSLQAPSEAKLNQEFEIKVVADGDLDSFNNKIIYSKNLIQALRIEVAGSDVNSWYKEEFDNTLGEVYLAGNITPKEGQKNIGSIIFKTKSRGQAKIMIEGQKEILVNIK